MWSLFIELLYARRIVGALCLRLPVAAAAGGRFRPTKKLQIAVTDPCIFDRCFRAAQLRQTVMGCRYHCRWKPCWGCLGDFIVDSGAGKNHSSSTSNRTLDNTSDSAKTSLKIMFLRTFLHYPRYYLWYYAPTSHFGS